MGLREPAAVPAVAAQIEALVVELAQALIPAPVGGRGRPPILTATVLWASVAIGVVRGSLSQLAVWRLTMDHRLWRGKPAWVTDEAVYKRLATAVPSPMASFFAAMTQLLVARVEPWQDRSLAPFATEVMVVDQTTLDPVARTLPELRAVPRGDQAHLPGQIAGLFDVRRQLWRRIAVSADPHQNEKRSARELVADLPHGSLVLADLGYFGFAWFDQLTDHGCWWISRLRAKTSYRTAHVFYQNDVCFDGLVWLGVHRADRAKHMVRLVRMRLGQREYAYLTNVSDPHKLPLGMIAALYARRWDIELAVKLVKRELGLHLVWSAKQAVIHHQIWAVLLIAQILQALRLEVAGRAGVEPFEVSMPLLVRYLPRYAAVEADPIGAYIADARRLGFIRPSRRIVHRAPIIDPDQIMPAPPGLVTIRTPRYAGRNCGSRTAAAK